MDEKKFQEVVAEALEIIPPAFRLRLTNVAIVVEEWPDRATLRAAGVRNRTELLGFYHGVPLTERDSSYGLTPPDKINIYRAPILKECHNDEEVRALVQRTLRHELAHYFGISDERLLELGAY